MYNIIDFCIEMIRFFGKSSSSSTFESAFGITPVVHEMGFHIPHQMSTQNGQIHRTAQQK
jgi:hypothetical protein